MTEDSCNQDNPETPCFQGESGTDGVSQDAPNSIGESGGQPPKRIGENSSKGLGNENIFDEEASKKDGTNSESPNSKRQKSYGFLKDERNSEYQRYLDGLEWEGGDHTSHEQSHEAFLRAASLGIDPDAAMEEVVSRIERVNGWLAERDLRRQLERAYDYVSGQKISSKTKIPDPDPAPKFKQGLIEKAAAKVKIDNIAERLRENSPISPEGLDSVTILEHIYHPGEKNLLFDNPFGEGTTYVSGSTELADIPPDIGNGVFMLLNPVDGEIHYNPREGTFSRRSLESVTAFRHLLLESDKVDAELWLRFIVRTSLKIVSITESGGKSVHVIVKIDADGKEHWDEIRADFKKLFVPFGADLGAMTAVRLTRLPGARRSGREQRLLYLNPKPLSRPIINDLED